MRFRLMYGEPFADSIGIPPRIQIGPLTPMNRSSIKTIEGSKVGSIVFPVFFVIHNQTPRGAINSFFDSDGLILGVI